MKGSTKLYGRAPLVAAWAVVVMLGAGCGPTPLTPEQMEQGPLAFLSDGRTTREQVLMELGPPSAQFEGERILTYRLDHDPDRGLTARPREIHPDETAPYRNQPIGYVQYHLVLVFDPQHVLQRHRLMPIR